MTPSLWILLRIRNISDKICRENRNTRFVFNKFVWKSCHLWDNVEKYCRARQAADENVMWRMRFACWITKAKDTHSEYVILIVFQWQHQLSERASMPVLFWTVNFHRLITKQHTYLW